MSPPTRPEPDHPREIELKLELSPADADRLATHPLLRGGKAKPHRHLTSVYFDTADLALHAAGLSLRVRSQGDRHVQTVKTDAAGAAGLFDRGEWETPVATPMPDFDALRRTPAGQILTDLAPEALKPIFSTEVDRTLRLVQHGTSELELTLDRGRVDTGLESAPLCELELELKRGTSADLFAVAHALAETTPLRLGVLSKSERGYALAVGKLNRVTKASPVLLSPAMSVADGFRAIAHACLKQLRQNEAVLLAARDAAALHQTRVALRRLRSAFSLFQEIVADEAFESIKARLKRVSEPLGEARNLDVFLTKTLAGERERRPDEAGLAELTREIEAKRERAYDAVVTALASPEWLHLLLDLVAWINAGPWLTSEHPLAVTRRERPLTAFAVEMLDERRRKVKKKGRRLEDLDPEALHKVRIHAKKLRYGAEFLGELYRQDRSARRRHEAFVAALEELQTGLGDLNDIATGRGIVADLAEPQPAQAAAGKAPAAFAAGIVAADQDSRAQALLDAAAEAHAAFVEARPFWR